MRGYRELNDAGAQQDLLGTKTRELIALAVAVTRSDATLKEPRHPSRAALRPTLPPVAT